MNTTNKTTTSKQPKNCKETLNTSPVQYTDIKADWKKLKASTHTFIDVFSGAGGITKGFTLAGLQPIAGFDCYKEAV